MTSQLAVSTSSTPNSILFRWKSGPNFCRRIRMTSAGDWMSGSDPRAVVTSARQPSTSSCVWPTPRWQCEQVSKRPAWQKDAIIAAVDWLRSSFGVLSPWTHSLSEVIVPWETTKTDKSPIECLGPFKSKKYKYHADLVLWRECLRSLQAFLVGFLNGPVHLGLE